jgi:hypothetical protein
MKTISLLALTVAFLGLAMSLQAQSPANARMPVTRFVTVGDGEAIDTSSIRKTINSLAASGGKTTAQELPSPGKATPAHEDYQL